MGKWRFHRIAQLALAGLLGSSSAIAGGPVVIAGGALDPAHQDADIYLDAPAPAAVPAGAACKAAKTYVDYHQAGRFADVPTLFSDDAVLLEPTRLNIRGKAEITQFYAKAIGALKPELAAVFYVGDATDCMVELSVRQMIDGRPRYRLASMDHFTVNKQGKVIRMIAFLRPSKIGLTPPHLDK